MRHVENAINVYAMLDTYWTGHASRIIVVYFTVRRGI